MYQLFISTIITELQQLLGEEYKISSQEIIKNNNAHYNALIILHNENTSPVIYMQKFYQEYLSGRDLNSILTDILETYNSYKSTISFSDDFFSNFNNLKSKIVYKLINYTDNHELLSDTPYIPFLDLAIVFLIYIEHPANPMFVLVKNQFLNIWKTTSSDLFDIANENTYKLWGCKIQSINDILKYVHKNQQSSDIVINSQKDLENVILKQLQTVEPAAAASNFPMYILSNKIGTFGASCILYPKLIKTIADSFNADIIIMPSSIHGATCC